MNRDSRERRDCRSEGMLLLHPFTKDDRNEGEKSIERKTCRENRKRRWCRNHRHTREGAVWVSSIIVSSVGELSVRPPSMLLCLSVRHCHCQFLIPSTKPWFYGRGCVGPVQIQLRELRPSIADDGPHPRTATPPHNHQPAIEKSWRKHLL